MDGTRFSKCAGAGVSLIPEKVHPPLLEPRCTPSVRRRLSRIGNSWGLILPKEVMELLGLEGGSEVEVQLAGNILLVFAPRVDPKDVEAGLAYLASRRERAEVYRRLAE